MAYPHQLKPLPYAADALEPHIDATTMKLHHGKHLQTYVNNLNKAIEPHTQLHQLTVKELLQDLDKLPQDIQAAVRNNGGGVFNHNLYFDLLAKGKTLKDGPLKKAIEAKWGSVDNFKQEFKQAGLTQFGSGWASLVKNDNGELEIVKTPNQDVPTYGKVVLNVDVWEHAYYISYQNRRADYLDNFWNVVNWDAVEQLYNE